MYSIPTKQGVVFFTVSVRKHFLHTIYYVVHTQLSSVGFHQPQQKLVMVTEQYIITTKLNLRYLVSPYYLENQQLLQKGRAE